MGHRADFLFLTWAAACCRAHFCASRGMTEPSVTVASAQELSDTRLWPSAKADGELTRFSLDFPG